MGGIGELEGEDLEEWNASFQEVDESLGTTTGEGNYLLSEKTDPKALKSHLKIQKEFLGILKRPGMFESEG